MFRVSSEYFSQTKKQFYDYIEITQIIDKFSKKKKKKLLLTGTISKYS